MVKLFSFLAIFALSSTGFAAAVDSPTEIKLDGATKVSADEAMKLHGEGALFLDLRTKAEYAEKHIKGAKFVPYDEKSDKVEAFDMSKDKFDLAKASDPSKPIVLYCAGVKCWKSFKGAHFAVKNLGYKNVKWYREGMPAWKGPTE